MAFKMAAKCFTLLCISLIIALWKENKDSLYLGKCLLSANCHHMAAISEFKMATTLFDMQFSMIDRCRLSCQLSLRKLIYLSVSMSIPRGISTNHSSSRLLITRLHSRSALKQLQFPLHDLADLHDTTARQATLAIGNVVLFGSLGCVPSSISNVWKFSDCPHMCPDW